MQLFYTVIPGDTLYNIAAGFSVPLDSLIAANNLINPDIIYPGQQLSIPPGINIKGLPLVPYYVVQPGDTLYRIAGRYNVATNGYIRPDLILQANGLMSPLIIPGMQLNIPYAPPGGPGLIAYTTDGAGSFDIWLYNPRTGANRPLTRGLAAQESVPFWSPDTGEIAFIGKNSVVYVVNVFSGGAAQIDQLEPGALLAWSPDSRRLAYTKNDQIILYDITAYQFRSIARPGASQAQWFPDGTELLFAAPDAAGIDQLYRIQLDGTGERQLTGNTDGPLHDVRLSPDGAFALYTSPGASISIIYTVNLTTGAVTQIPGGPLAKNYFPAWSPDSTRVAYSATEFSAGSYHSLIRTSGRFGQNDRTWANSDCFATPVSWSPDSSRLAYLSGCGSGEFAGQMWVIDLRHPVPVQTIAGVRITALQWSPL